MSSEERFEIALLYRKAGLDVIPDHPTEKYPVGITGWQQKNFTEAELSVYIISKGWGIGLRNLEGLDFDNSADPKATPTAEESFKNWKEIVNAISPGLVDKLVIEKTQHEGCHVGWKCAVIEGNQKLASRFATEDELQKEPKLKAVNFIETRGLGGQFVVSPTPGYTLIQGDWRNLPQITPEERSTLLQCARSLDLMPVVTEDFKVSEDNFNGERPGDIFNREGADEALDLLKQEGWVSVFERGGIIYLRRPGKDRGVSATFGYVTPGIFYNFSSNGAPFEPSKAYTPFAIFTYLKHNGDFHSAASELAKRYGMSRTEDKDNQKKSVADLALDLVAEEKLELLLDQLGEPQVVLPERQVNAVPVKSAYFARWLRGQFFKKFKKGISGENLSTVTVTLEGQAFAQGKSEILYNRWAFKDNELYFDKGDWQNVVHITQDGWEITQDSPVKFHKFAHHKIQTDPTIEGDISLISKYINLTAKDEKLLLFGHIAAICFPDNPRACLITSGPAGAAKTTLLRLIQSIVDPSETDVLRFTTDTKEVAQQAYKHYCLFYDNLSSLNTDQSDFLCTVVTGLSYSKRQLYSDDSDIIWKIKAALGLSGITLVPTRSDLLSRSLILVLEEIEKDKRLPETTFWRDFETDKPKILAGLYNILSKILASDLQLEDLPRMADYVLAATKAAIAMGYTASDYLNAFDFNIGRQNDSVIESSPVAQTILSFMDARNTWTGSSSELHALLLQEAENLKLQIKDSDKYEDSFPKSSSWLWRKIIVVKPNLLELGIKVERFRTGTGTSIKLSKVPKTAANTAVAANQAPKNPKSTEDAASYAASQNDQFYAQNDNMTTVTATKPYLDNSSQQSEPKPEINKLPGLEGYGKT